MNVWLAERFGLVLLEPGFLWLLAALPLAAAARAARRPPELPFGPFRLLGEAGLPVSWRHRLRRAPAALAFAGLAVIAVALARPAERAALPRRSLGVDLAVALDRSSSMAERDLDPARTRLEVARAAAQRFLEGRDGDRVALIAFARRPELLCAPTLDRRPLRETIARLEPVAADGPEDLTGIGGAVAQAAELLRRAPGPSRVLVLLSDGEENVAGPHAPDALAPAEAAELCAAWGVRVHAIAVGPAAGRDGALRSLAEGSGGGFHRATDAGALERVYRAIDALEPSPLAEPEVRLRELASWCALAGVAFLGAASVARRLVGRVGP